MSKMEINKKKPSASGNSNFSIPKRQKDLFDPLTGTVSKVASKQTMLDIVAWGAITFGFAAGINIFFFLLALIFKTDKFTDLAGSLSFITLAVVGLTWVSDYFPRQIILSSLVIVWALRLGIYLVFRVIRRGSDERFNEMRKVWWKWALFWSTQITWVWVVFLPVMFVQATHTDKPLNACDYVGWSVWFVGLMIETIADAHRNHFNSDKSENRPKFLSTGLWKYSRHPNYLGETLLWFGIWLSSSNGLWGIETAYAILGLFSPAITFVLLVFISGIPPAEKRDDERFKELPEYYEYKKQTSPYFFFPPSWYRGMPMILRKVPFCDIRDYSKLREPSVENGDTSNVQAGSGSKKEGKIWRDPKQIQTMLPLFHYLFSVLVCAPLVVKYGMKKEPGYQSFLEILAIAAAFNVLAGLKVFRKDGCNLKSILNGLFGLFFGALFYHAIAVIFGAHYLNNYQRTCAWASWMSSMTTFPLGLVFGFDPKLWFASIVQRQHDGSSRMSRLVCDVYSLWFGSWAGCIVIPLDWDRPWQAWPIPNVVGSMLLAFTTAVGFLIKDAVRGGVKSAGKTSAAGPKTPLRVSAQPKAKASPAPKPKASPAPKAKASPAPVAPKATSSPAKSPVKSRAAPKAKAAAPTRSRSISRSPAKKAAVAANDNVPATPKATRSKSKVATPRTSSRLRK